MNKRTKILFVVYLVIAPLVYFISSAHTPNKQKLNIENFAQEFVNQESDQNTLIAFISSPVKTSEYQQALAQTLKGTATQTMIFTVPVNHCVPKTVNKMSIAEKSWKVFSGKTYFKKAGVRTDKKSPSLQLFLINKQKRLIYQEQHYESNLLDLSNLTSQVTKI